MAAGDPSHSEATAAAYEARSRRAEWLSNRVPSAREPLLFASGLFLAQARMSKALSAVSGDLLADLQLIASASERVVTYCATAGPPLLADAARRQSDIAGALQSAWSGEQGFDYLSRATLSVYLHLLRRRDLRVRRAAGPCPFCGGSPWVASRRAAANTDGASRFLHCSLCLNEWQVPRIRCLACGEADPAKLPVFSAEEHAGARLEACETCRGYLKSVDLSEDAQRIPEVDDLTSLALDLWGASRGFHRLEPGAAGALTAVG